MPLLRLTYPTDTLDSTSVLYFALQGRHITTSGVMTNKKIAKPKSPRRAKAFSNQRITTTAIPNRTTNAGISFIAEAFLLK